MQKPDNHSCGNSGAIGCPFFMARADHEIHCEGILPDSKIVNRFRTRTSCKQQTTIYCQEHFRKCEIFRMLMAEKYSDE